MFVAYTSGSENLVFGSISGKYAMAAAFCETLQSGEDVKAKKRPYVSHFV